MTTPKAARIPPFIYGTAWKKEASRGLVRQALVSGFRGVDTAAQPKHYREDLVGQGIRDALNDGDLKREDLYIQTKFTSIHGQDPRQMPYDPKKSITEQVVASMASSLHNLRPSETASAAESYVDCLVLHSPLPSMAHTQEAWRAMESHVPHQARTLGISNVYHIEVLQALYDSANVKPSVVQNRFFRDTGYDSEIRAFCTEKGMVYQSFWTLTANPHLLASKAVESVAERARVSKPVALYGLVLGLGNTSVLNGTTNEGRMKEDLGGLEKIRQWSQHSNKDWAQLLKAFQMLIGKV